MVKRKARSDSEDEAQLSSASSHSKPAAKKAATKKAKSKSKLNNPPTVTNSTDKNPGLRGGVHTNNEGEKYIDLGKKKRATVRSFKDIPLLDIREFYGEDEKPGKKGISLTLEQWQTLKSSSDTIDDLFSKLSEGKK